MPVMKSIALGLFAAATFLGAGKASAEVVLIVAADSPIVRLRAAQVADIFLGKLERLPDGVRITPVDAADGSREREEFYRRFIGRSPAQMRAYWSKLIFTGKNYPPREATSNAVLKKLVAGNPAFVGYVDESAVDQSVKVVQVVE